VRAEFAEAKRLAGGADLRDVARFWASHNRDGEIVAATVGEAIEHFLEAKEGRAVSDFHAKTLRSHLGLFCEGHGGMRLSLVSRAEVLAYLLAMSKRGAHPRTVANHRGTLANFFGWCQRNKLVAMSPMVEITEGDLPIVPGGAIGVLSVAQCAAVMRWVDEHRPRFAAALALQLFAGIRVAEVRRLRWEENFDFTQRAVILRGWRLEGGKARRVVKTGDDWALRDLPENLWLWLEKYRAQGAVTCPANNALALMRRAFAKLKPPVAEWPHNALRHTFCTMLMSLHGNANLVATLSRHSNAQTLFNHYVAALVSKKEAERFCKIVPTR
jgi:integrase